MKHRSVSHKIDSCFDGGGGGSYIIASHPHFAIRTDAILWGDFQFDVEFALCQVHFRCYFASSEIDSHWRWTVVTGIFTTFKQKQMQVLVREPVSFVSF